MFTVTFSAGVVFALGVVVGAVVGVIGLSAIAILTNKKK